MTVPSAVYEKARLAGSLDWLAALPDLIAELSLEWHVTVSDESYQDATEAFVAPADCADGTPAVLKIVVPAYHDAARNEIRTLRLAGGSGCVRLLKSDESRRAMLVERLGPSMSTLRLPGARRRRVLCDLAARVWRPVNDADLPTGVDKARSLIE